MLIHIRDYAQHQGHPGTMGYLLQGSSPENTCALINVKEVHPVKFHVPSKNPQTRKYPSPTIMGHRFTWIIWMVIKTVVTKKTVATEKPYAFVNFARSLKAPTTAMEAIITTGR